MLLKHGLALWADSVLPALLPFFIATELLSYTNIIPFLGRILNKFMKPLFNVPGEGSFAFIMGIISGYPVGAKIVANFRENNTCTKEECERLLAFTNNSGPLFIVGTVGISLIGDTSIGIILLLAHILSSIIVGILFRFWKSDDRLTRKYGFSYNYFKSKNYRNATSSKKTTVSFSNLGEILAKSIMNSINTIIMIGGFVVLFSVIISILENSHALIILSMVIHPILELLHIPTEFATGIFSGIIELTNGLKTISIIPIKEYTTTIIISGFLLGFGGISVLLQVFSIISKTDLSMKPYIIGKILHSIISAIFLFIFFKFFVLFSVNL